MVTSQATADCRLRVNPGIEPPTFEDDRNLTHLATAQMIHDDEFEFAEAFFEFEKRTT